MLHRFCLAFTALAFGAQPSGAAPPESWETRGIGGGGALFQPAFSPVDSNEVSVACDVTQTFRSSDLGTSHTQLDFRQVLGGVLGGIRYSSDPSVLYTVSSANDASTPMRSDDSGTTWTALSGDPTGGEVWSLWVDAEATERVLVSDYTTLYFSSDGGASFGARHVEGGGLHVAGVLWADDVITVGTATGMLVSNDAGASFAPLPVPGLPVDEAISSWAGATDGTTTRFYAVTLGAGDVYPGVRGGEHREFRSVYSYTAGTPAWIPSTVGILPGHTPFFTATAPGHPDVAWLAGGSDVEFPTVYRSTDAGASWTSVFLADGNLNIETAWCGRRGDHDWWYAEYPYGFAVSPTDPLRAAISDFGFLHLTEDGGASWRQAYVHPDDDHPAGADTPRRQSYRSNGLENTSHWFLTWTSPDGIFASSTDISGMRSVDGGLSWSFDYSGHDLNTMYHAVLDERTGRLYGGTSSVHDLYQTTYVADSRIDGGRGAVLWSDDEGATWETLHDFGHPVVWLALSPSDPERLYASVVHSGEGDIYTTGNLSEGAASTWTRLASPPRTEGHPFNIHVLSDGTLVASYSARRDGSGAFTASSGVFVSEDGGVSWLDRSHAEQLYWTKDLTVDPHDVSESTWYAGVWSGWGGPANDLGGVFRTRDRGQSWTRIWTWHRASSVAVNPSDPDEAYVSTEVAGLWHTEDLTSDAPNWGQTSHTGQQPERVFWNPYDEGELWVVNFGSGLRVARVDAGTPDLLRSSLSSRRPAAPALSSVLPLDPVGDLHVAEFSAGELDPDAGVVDDSDRPVVFYVVTSDDVIRLSRATGRRLRIDY